VQPFRRRPDALASAAILLTAALTASCASRSHFVRDPDGFGSTGPTAPVRAAGEVFAYEKSPIATHEELLEEHGGYRVLRLSFPSVGNGEMVTVDYHQSTLPGRHPVVVVLPIWGRYVYPSNAVTRTLRKRSNGAVHVLNLLDDGFLTDWPALETAPDEEAFTAIFTAGAENERNTVIDIRRLVDWAETRHEIDREAIGLVGFSHSAIIAPTIAAAEPRIAASVLIMGGAHPHRIVARCAGPRMTAVQQRAASAFGWDRDYLERVLEPIYAAIDPANYPGDIDPASVLIFEAGRDTCIDEVARTALWEAAGRPQRWVINTSHKRAFLTMTPFNLNWMRKRIWSFFEARLLSERNH
jgi:dienelactone hydrolase